MLKHIVLDAFNELNVTWSALRRLPRGAVEHFWSANGSNNVGAVGWYRFFLVAAIAMSAFYEWGARPPIAFSVAAFVVALGAVALWLRPGFPVLSIYVLVLYSLPFVNLFEHLTHSPDYFRGQELIWGLAADEYQRDPTIVARMGFAGAIGAVALAAGMFVATALARPAAPVIRTERPLAWPSFALVAVGAIAFAWMQAPTATIFEVAYTKGVSPLQSAGINFNAATIVAATLILVLVIDVLSESGVALLLKALATVVVIVLVAFWYQFLRGEREAIAIFPAVVVLAVFRPSVARVMRQPQAIIATVLLSAVVVMAAQVVGSIRSDVAGRHPVEAVTTTRLNLSTGTWSAVLLSPLSVVGDAERGLSAPRWGATYIEYALSLPPSFIAQALHYERPIEANHGPAWDIRFGIGGVHLMVVPFVNFRTPGVAGILFAFGALVGASAVAVRRQLTSGRLLWLGVLLVVAPRWLWYGDLYVVRAAMAFAAAWVALRVFPRRGLPGGVSVRQPDVTGSSR